MNNMQSIAIAVFLLSTMSYGLQLHEQWWQQHALDKKAKDFKMWLGKEDAPSRVFARSYIKERDFKSMLDVGCGLCVEFFGLKNDQVDIQYRGLDLTPKLVRRALKLGINVIEGSVEQIPLPDNNVEICYVRHVLEHLQFYENALSELIRVASKEVIIIFFLKPTDGDEDINAGNADGYPVYHNTYNKLNLENFIKSHKKVKRLWWESVPNTQEVVLHIILQ